MTDKAKPPGSIPYFSSEALEGLQISTQDVVQAIERLISGQRAGRVFCAPKAVVLPGNDRYVMATLSAADEVGVIATKSLIVNPHNTERGLPTHNAIVSLLDSNTGLPLAVLDGNWITAVRTAGLSLAAGQRMARADATSIAFIGCGVEARSHLAAFASAFPLKEIHAFGRGAPNRDALCGMAEGLGLKATAAPSARAAIENADIVVTAVALMPPPERSLDPAWVRPGTFVTMVDLALPWKSENMNLFQRIVIDDLVQEATMPKPLVAPALVTGDLNGLVCGDILGRQTPDERTAFAFRGIAVGDLALAGLAYARAKQAGLLAS